MISRKYNFLYKTTCLVTERFYIGVHSTDNLADGYLGSGLLLKHSINKHGIDNHNREILEFFDSRTALLDKEKEIVNKDLLKEPCMNRRPGGDGGDTFNFLSSETQEKMRELSRQRISKMWLDEKLKKPTDITKQKISKTKTGVPIHSIKYKKQLTERLKQEWANGTRSKDKIRILGIKNGKNKKGIKLSDDHKRKVSEGLKKSKLHAEGRIKTFNTCMAKKLVISQNIHEYLKTHSNEEAKQYFSMSHSAFFRYKKYYKQNG